MEKMVEETGQMLERWNGLRIDSPAWDKKSDDAKIGRGLQRH
jgi:hypothetical protein